MPVVVAQCPDALFRHLLRPFFHSRGRKASLPDTTLSDAVAEMGAGLIDADLGGSVHKKRVPVLEESGGGARIILGSNLKDRWFFLFDFEKNDRATIDSRELAALQKTAAALLALDTTALDHSVIEGELKEICHEENPPAI